MSFLLKRLSPRMHSAANYSDSKFHDANMGAHLRPVNVSALLHSLLFDTPPQAWTTISSLITCLRIPEQFKIKSF